MGAFLYGVEGNNFQVELESWITITAHDCALQVHTMAGHALVGLSMHALIVDSLRTVVDELSAKDLFDRGTQRPFL